MTATPTKNRRAGAKFEIDLMKTLREEGLDVERLRLTGANDEGDLVVRCNSAYIVIEAKSGAMHPADFVRQAKVESENFAKHRSLKGYQVSGIAVIKARGKGIRDAYVLTTLSDYLGLEDE